MHVGIWTIFCQISLGQSTAIPAGLVLISSFQWMKYFVGRVYIHTSTSLAGEVIIESSDQIKKLCLWVKITCLAPPVKRLRATWAANGSAGASPSAFGASASERPLPRPLPRPRRPAGESHNHVACYFFSYISYTPKDSIYLFMLTPACITYLTVPCTLIVDSLSDINPVACTFSKWCRWQQPAWPLSALIRSLMTTGLICGRDLVGCG